MGEVAIIGIGMHEFGRHEGISGMEQGVVAVRRALADSGLTWQDMQFAYGGSKSAGAADLMVSKLGLTGLQFINVANGCATGGSALFSAWNSIEMGRSTRVDVPNHGESHPCGPGSVRKPSPGTVPYRFDIASWPAVMTGPLRASKKPHPRSGKRCRQRQPAAAVQDAVDGPVPVLSPRRAGG